MYTHISHKILKNYISISGVIWIKKFNPFISVCNQEYYKLLETSKEKKKKTETLQPGNDLQPNQLINERKKDGTTEIDAKDL